MSEDKSTVSNLLAPRESAIPPLLTEKDACRYLNCSRSFLANGRSRGDIPGHTPTPPFIKVGRAVRYHIEDLNRWIADNRRQPGGLN